MSRGFKINNNSREYERGERVGWLDEFADRYAKTAVEVARERSQTSIYDQISAIMENPPTHTVESKVKELQDRIGLTEYLQRMASAPGESNIFGKFGPQTQQNMLDFCRNKINEAKGYISVPALLYDLCNTFGQQGLQPGDVDNNKNVEQYLNKLILEQIKLYPAENPSNLGKSDTGNDDANNNADFFKNLMPAQV